MVFACYDPANLAVLHQLKDSHLFNVVSKFVAGWWRSILIQKRSMDRVTMGGERM